MEVKTIMKLCKTFSKKTYTNKKGEEKHIKVFYIQFDNGRKVPIKPLYNDQYPALDFMAEYVNNEDIK